jgi:RimJ/RimL family protein N-acetyltransferase
MFKTPRIVFEKISAADLDDLVALDSDAEVMRFISGGVPTDRQTYLDGLLGRMMAYDAPDLGYFAARGAGGFLGWFHLRPSVRHPETMLEVGYRLRRDMWGKGLATEGARQLCRVAFEHHGAPWVDACAVEENLASIAVMRKCGMQPRGRFRHPRAPIEVLHYVADQAGFEARLSSD